MDTLGGIFSFIFLIVNPHEGFCSYKLDVVAFICNQIYALVNKTLSFRFESLFSENYLDIRIHIRYI